MADTVAQPTLDPVAEDHPLRTQLNNLLVDLHQPLLGAVIVPLWTLDRPMSSWGSTKIASEETWWLCRADIVMRINRDLYEKLSPPAQVGLLDHLLSFVSARTEGRSTMATAVGTRQLFERTNPSLSVHPEVMARNPQFVLEIDELNRLRSSLASPEQFMLGLAPEDDEAA